ncbi:hypothetical protein DFQ27_004096 [Actinomortierella ambigua]|uniref:ABC transporter domain-containing protein n=1 Tax=Actinomortierella ambigua TaxID=1343610 RepID=A0A9P6U4Y8_9FUNG|nr:hypothetical protein DFQ27_004096 [Actinomortierella ambigua]
MNSKRPATAPSGPERPDALGGNGPSVEVCVQDLSLSIVSKPMLVTSAARRLRLKAVQAAQWTKNLLQIKSIAASSESSIPSSTRDVTKEGVSILRHVSMAVKPGQVCLLLGSSGAGKTTLLNALAGRIDPSQTAISGSIRFSNKKPSKYWKTGAVGYLDQNDHLQSYLTPRETLEFVANMHTATTRVTPVMKETIERLLLRLGLRDCADRRIGNASEESNGSDGSGHGGGSSSGSGRGQQGISGGEKRRVSVAIQLLTDPSILFCDEPTSGLDAFSSFELMKTLTTLAKDTGKTIVVSIHQPRSEIFQLLAENQGQLVVLSLGETVYSGPIADSLEWFVTGGIAGACPRDMNPFEYMLDMSAVDYSSESLEAFTRKRRQLLVDAWAASTEVGKQEATGDRALPMVIDSDHDAIHQPERGLQAQVRDRAWYTSFMVIHVILGVWMGFIYYGVRAASLALRARASLMLAMAAFQPFLLMTVMVCRGSSDIRIFDRERKDRWYGPVPFIISSMIKNFPLSSLGTLVYSTIVYYIAGLRSDKILYYLVVMLALVAIQFTHAGFYIPYDMIPPYYKWANSISYLSLGFKILLSAEFSDREYECPYQYNGAPDPERCAIFEGNSVLEDFQSKRNYYPLPIAYFLIHTAVYMLLAWIALTLKVVEPSAPSTAGNASGVIFELIISPFLSSNTKAKELAKRTNQKNRSKELETEDDTKTLALFSPSQGSDEKMYKNNHNINETQTPLSFDRTETNVSTETLTAADADADAAAVMNKPSSLRLSLTTNVSSTKTSSSSSSSSARDGATRIDIFRQQLNVREPVEIRLDNVSLSAVTTSRWKVFHGPQQQRQQQQPQQQGPEEPDQAREHSRHDNNNIFTRWIQRHRHRHRHRQTTTKHLLQGVTAVFPAGKLTAILGGSGAGKTSLLNLMLGRSPSNLVRGGGDVWFNGSRNPSLRKVNSVCGYVRQDDSFLLSHLTVRETLQYAAELSMATGATTTTTGEGTTQSYADKMANVEAIMELMGLLECADVLVGNGGDAMACSGGQRRRVSIALQLVLEPSCLVLDEPTTGLDAMTALALVRTLKGVAQTGRTVVCSMHQPRHDIWNEVDHALLLMTEGRVGYAGKATDALRFFAQAGFDLPEHTNPAVDVASINFQSPETEAATREQVDKLAEAFVAYRQKIEQQQQQQEQERHESTTTGSNNDDASSSPPMNNTTSSKLKRRPPYYATFWHATPILARRSFQNVYRQKGLFFNRLLQPLLISLISSLFFNIDDNSPRGLIVRGGFVQQLMLLSFNGLIAGVAVYPMERDLAFHEMSNGIYGGASFMMAYMVNEVPMTILASVIMTAVNRIFAMFQWTLMETVVFFFVCIAYVTTGECLAIIIGSWTKNNGVTINTGIAYVLLFSLMAGVVNPNLVQPLVDMGYISLWKYGTIALTLMETQGLKVDCTASMERRGLCPFRTGEEGLRYIRFHKYKLSESLIAVAGLTILYRFVAWASVLARVKKQKWQ